MRARDNLKALRYYVLASWGSEHRFTSEDAASRQTELGLSLPERTLRAWQLEARGQLRMAVLMKSEVREKRHGNVLSLLWRVVGILS